MHVLTLAVCSLQWALLPWVAEIWGLPSRIGVIAAVLGGVMPIPGALFKWEAVYVGLLLVILAGLTGLVTKSGSPMGLWWLAGIAWGIGLLFSPVLLLPWIGWLVLAVSKSGWAVWRRAVPTAILPLLIILPWTVRNYQTFHHILMIRGNLGQTLLVSNNDCTVGWIKADLQSGCLTRFNAYDNVDVAKGVARDGEYAFNADQMRQAELWIQEHPQRFLELTALRIRLFWLPTPSHEEGMLGKANVVFICILTVLSVPGLYLIGRQRRWAGALLVSGLALYSAIYSLSFVDLRYRYPILWITVLGAAACLYWAARQSSWPDCGPRGRGDQVLGRKE